MAKERNETYYSEDIQVSQTETGLRVTTNICKEKYFSSVEGALREEKRKVNGELINGSIFFMGGIVAAGLGAMSYLAAQRANSLPVFAVDLVGAYVAFSVASFMAASCGKALYKGSLAKREFDKIRSIISQSGNIKTWSVGETAKGYFKER